MSEDSADGKTYPVSGPRRPEVLEYVDYQPAEPGPQQVRVRNQAIGLNFIDTYYRGGLYTLAELPCPGWAMKGQGSLMRWAVTCAT